MQFAQVDVTNCFNTLAARGDNPHFQVLQDSDTAIFRFDTYVCSECGFTAMFVKSDEGLPFLRRAGNCKR